MEKARAGIAISGAGLIAGFFLPWISYGGFHISAFEMATAPGAFSIAPFATVMLCLMPVAGLAMLLSALANAKAMRAISVVTGLGILGYGGYRIASEFIAASGWGLWIVIGAAVAAIAVPLALRAKK